MGCNSLPVTVVVLTKDEERDLPDCLGSLLPFFDDIHVLDSGSSDGTVDVARTYGVAVHENPFSGFGNQRNWAIDNIPHRYAWVLHLDADERPTHGFIEELKSIVESEPEEAGFYVPSRLMLGRRWLRRSGGYPVYQVRLFHRSRLRFENHGHGQREVSNGKLGYMREPYLHFAFSKGITQWMEKHARYAAKEADLVANQGTNLLSDLRAFLFGDRIERRRSIKRLSLLLPARGYMRMFHILVLKRGLLDGRAGITYAKMMAAYESMFVAYLAALQLEDGKQVFGQNTIADSGI